MRDPYDILGVSRSADEPEFRAAYRALAKRHHPDLNPGKAEAAERFKEINAAHDLLSDPDKRARFDRGEIDAEGNEVFEHRPFFRYFAEDARGRYGGTNGFSQDDINDFLSRAFGDQGDGRAGPRRGPDLSYALTLGFLEAANGGERRVGLPDGRALDVRVPAGAEDGQVLRLWGQGGPGHGGGPAGDALIEITVAPHALLRRSGEDIHLTLPVSLREAVLGASLDVPTITGPVRLVIPPGSGEGTRLRLRERGIHKGERAGHQIVTLRVIVPAADEPELAAFLKTWTPRHGGDPRAGMATP